MLINLFPDNWIRSCGCSKVTNQCRLKESSRFWVLSFSLFLFWLSLFFSLIVFLVTTFYLSMKASFLWTSSCNSSFVPHVSLPLPLVSLLSLSLSTLSHLFSLSSFSLSSENYHHFHVHVQKSQILVVLSRDRIVSNIKESTILPVLWIEEVLCAFSFFLFLCSSIFFFFLPLFASR